MIPTRRQLLSSVLIAPAALSGETDFVRARGKDLLGADGRKIMLRGINLGNWLEPEGYMFLFEGGPQSPREIEEFFRELIGPSAAEDFWRTYRENYIDEADIDFIRRCGCNSVRVPLHYKFFLPGANGFALLDPLLGSCRRAGVLAILDMHCAPGGQTGTNIDDSYSYPWLYESSKDQELLIEIWRRIAERYRDETAVLGYDLLNEPIPHFPQLQKYNSALEPLYKRITRAIRSVDSNHIVILGGARWDTNFTVFGAPFDDKVIYQFHTYWAPPERKTIQSYIDFRDRYNVPIWCGESGENNDDWVRQFVQTLEQNDIGWCFWPYKKMEKPSCIASVKAPPDWNEIVDFAKRPSGTGNAEKSIASRPSLQASRESLNQLLSNIRLANCRINSGYLQALGLRVPESR